MRRRTALTAAFCLAGGAAATVLSAWIPALLWGDPIERGHVPYHGTSVQTTSGFRLLREHPSVGVDHWITTGGPSDKADPHLPVMAPPRWVVVERSFAGIHTFAYGWPARCARMVVFSGSGVAYTQAPEPFWHIPTTGKPLALPIHPVWSGVLFNSTFYTVILAALSFVLTRLRCALRRRRGLCPACAYNLIGLAHGSPCPECGHPFPGQPPPPFMSPM